MEPILPQPHVVLIGQSPAVITLTGLLGTMDWRVTVIADGGDGTGFDENIGVVTHLDDITSLEIDDTTPIVVATQGHHDEPALTAALATGTPYVGLVASSTRAKTVLGYLRDQGVAEADLRRIHTPAGLDLGQIEHREIGLAVLAELVAIKASGGIAGVATEVETAPESAIDPVCGMTVQIEGARFSTVVADTGFYFCCPACLASFGAAPAEYTDIVAH